MNRFRRYDRHPEHEFFSLSPKIVCISMFSTCKNFQIFVNIWHLIIPLNKFLVPGNGIVWLTIPSQENGIYNIQVLLDCTPSDQNCTLQTSSKVKLTGAVKDVIIRPSSNYYRPGETSKIFQLYSSSWKSRLNFPKLVFLTESRSHSTLREPATIRYLTFVKIFKK